METDHLTGRMGTEPILSIKRSVPIDTMINFDGDSDGDGYGVNIPFFIEPLLGRSCGKRKFFIVNNTSEQNLSELI